MNMLRPTALVGSQGDGEWSYLVGKHSVGGVT